MSDPRRGIRSAHHDSPTASLAPYSSCVITPPSPAAHPHVFRTATRPAPHRSASTTGTGFDRLCPAHTEMPTLAGVCRINRAQLRNTLSTFARTSSCAPGYFARSGSSALDRCRGLDAHSVRCFEVDKQHADLARLRDIPHRQEHAVPVVARKGQRRRVDYRHDTDRSPLYVTPSARLAHSR